MIATAAATHTEGSTMNRERRPRRPSRPAAPGLPGASYESFDSPTAEARPLAVGLARAALAAWRDAAAREQDARDRYERSAAREHCTPGVRDRWYAETEFFESWLNVAGVLEQQAREGLAVVVLAFHGLASAPTDLIELAGRDWEPVGLDVDGAWVVVAPDPGGRPTPVVAVVGPGRSDSCEFGSPDWPG